MPLSLWELSAFNLAAVELRTDRHQHQENSANGQNYKAVDGLFPLQSKILSQSFKPSCPSTWTVSQSLSGASCFEEAEREASSSETEDQN